MTDANDLDGDGNTAEIICVSLADGANVSVSSSASMASEKYVKGQLDAEYSRFPDTGLTVAGGSLSYKVVVTNTGNVPMPAW